MCTLMFSVQPLKMSPAPLAEPGEMNGGSKKGALGALVDYNDSDSDEGSLILIHPSDTV